MLLVGGLAILNFQPEAILALLLAKNICAGYFTFIWWRRKKNLLKQCSINTKQTKTEASSDQKELLLEVEGDTFSYFNLFILPQWNKVLPYVFVPSPYRMMPIRPLPNKPLTNVGLRCTLAAFP